MRQALAVLHVAAGDMEAGERAIEQAVAATLASKGLPLTGRLLFWVSQVSIHMVLVGHSPEGIRLMEKAVADAATFLPRMSMFARFLLSMVLCASGEYVRARSLLPENPGDPNWAMSINSGWVRALLVKTGEPAAAAALLRRLLDLASGPAADAVTKAQLFGLLPRAGNRWWRSRWPAWPRCARSGSGR